MDHRGTTTANEILTLLLAAGPRGMTSLELHDHSPRAQARIGELKQDGHQIETILPTRKGAVARYIYRGTEAPDGHQGGFKVRIEGQTVKVSRVRPARHQEAPLDDAAMERLALKIQVLVESYLPVAPASTPVEQDEDDLDALMAFLDGDLD